MTCNSCLVVIIGTVIPAVVAIALNSVLAVGKTGNSLGNVEVCFVPRLCTVAGIATAAQIHIGLCPTTCVYALHVKAGVFHKESCHNRIRGKSVVKLSNEFCTADDLPLR